MKRWLKYKAAKFIDGGVRIFVSSPCWNKPQLHLSVLSGGKYLFVVLDHLGDAVMSSSAIVALKSSFPDCALTVLTRPVNVPVFQNNPYVDDIMTDDAPWWSDRPVWDCLQPAYWWNLLRNVSRIRREKYDVIVDLRGDLRHLVLFGTATNPGVLLGYGKTGGESLLSTHVPYDPCMHEIDKKLALLHPLGITGIRPSPKIWLLPEELENATQFVGHLLGDTRSPLILLDPGGKPVQRWPLEHFASIANVLHQRFRQRVLVSAAPAYSHLAEDLVRNTGRNVALYIEKVTIRDLIALVAVCDLVISSDTGIAHIASAVGTRTVTLFGPTNPSKFWKGVPGSCAVKSPESCNMANLHETCFKPSGPVPGICMPAITPEKVLNAALETLNKGNRIEQIGHCKAGSIL